jgi:hypothetical protein
MGQEAESGLFRRPSRLKNSKKSPVNMRLRNRCSFANTMMPKANTGVLVPSNLPLPFLRGFNGLHSRAGLARQMPLFIARIIGAVYRGSKIRDAETRSSQCSTAKIIAFLIVCLSAWPLWRRFSPYGQERAIFCSHCKSGERQLVEFQNGPQEYDSFKVLRVPVQR